MSEDRLNVTVSGSFRRAMGAVQDAVYRLTDAGARVLSPADPRVVDHFGDFLFVASDRVRAIKLVQSRHLAAIEASDFLWLVAPDGYIGQSGALELGYALASGTPVFGSAVPTDLTLRQYVTTLESPEEAMRVVRGHRSQGQRPTRGDVLLDPAGTIQQAHDDLQQLALALQNGAPDGDVAATAAANRLHEQIARPLRSH